MNDPRRVDGNRQQSGTEAGVLGIWVWCSDLAKVVLACRFSTFFFLVGLVFFVLAGQGREFLRAFAEVGLLALYLNMHAYWFCTAIGIWLATTWLTSMALMSRYLPAAEAGRIRAMKAYVPRWLALCCAATVIAGAVLEHAWWLAGIIALMALVFYKVSSRFDGVVRHLLEARRTVSFARPWRRADVPVAGPGVTVSGLVAMSFGVLLLSWVLFVLFAVYPVTLPQTVGAPAILLFAASSWIVFDNICLIFLPRLLNAPALGVMLLLWALVISPLNDNHVVRTLPQAMPPIVTVEQHFDGWMAARAGGRDVDKPYPLVIVAAAGGGIRAAHWTATLLSEIQREHPQFKDHVFAISGVSGGSLGASVFASQLADDAGAAARHCAIDGKLETNPVHCAQAVLSHDFLSPAVAALLYSDLVQRFLPWRIERWDRARALEFSWERAWRTHAGGERFAESFDNLWQGNLRYRIPALFLNGTWVETGQRIIMSNVKIDDVNFNNAAGGRARQDWTRRAAEHGGAPERALHLRKPGRHIHAWR